MREGIAKASHPVTALQSNNYYREHQATGISGGEHVACEFVVLAPAQVKALDEEPDRRESLEEPLYGWGDATIYCYAAMCYRP